MLIVAGLLRGGWGGGGPHRRTPEPAVRFTAQLRADSDSESLAHGTTRLHAPCRARAGGRHPPSRLHLATMRAPLEAAPRLSGQPGPTPAARRSVHLSDLGKLPCAGRDTRTPSLPWLVFSPRLPSAPAPLTHREPQRVFSLTKQVGVG